MLPLVPTTISAGFDTPTGRRITLQLPKDVSAEDLDYFDEVLPLYLALLRKRISEAAPHASAGGGGGT